MNANDVGYLVTAMFAAVVGGFFAHHAGDFLVAAFEDRVPRLVAFIKSKLRPRST